MYIRGKKYKSNGLLTLAVYGTGTGTGDRYYAENVHIGCFRDQDWTPQSHLNIIKTHHQKIGT